MNHESARLQIGAHPGELSAALAAHLAACSRCTQFREQMLRLEEDLRCVLLGPLGIPDRVPAAVPFVARPLAPRIASAPARRRWLALAASLIVGIALSLTLWSLRPEPSLASQLIGHVQSEPWSWSPVEPMTAVASAAVLRAAGIALDGSAGQVLYARICLFRGRWVPHLVVRTTRGAVTVLILRSESVPSRQSFRENGYAGVLIPEPAGGTLAVLSRNGSDIEAVARQLNRSVRWMP